jgi:hypothetical protein
MTHGSNYSLGVYLGQSKVADLHAHHDRFSLSYDAPWLKKGFCHFSVLLTWGILTNPCTI